MKSADDVRSPDEVLEPEPAVAPAAPPRVERIEPPKPPPKPKPARAKRGIVRARIRKSNLEVDVDEVAVVRALLRIFVRKKP